MSKLSEQRSTILEFSPNWQRRQQSKTFQPRLRKLLMAQAKIRLIEAALNRLKQEWEVERDAVLLDLERAG